MGVQSGFDAERLTVEQVMALPSRINVWHVSECMVTIIFADINKAFVFIERHAIPIVLFKYDMLQAFH